jgi:hypothetical protein
MAKVKISEFDVNPDNNTDINNINIAEGCAPSGINNAIRQLMSDLKEFQTGAGGDSITAVGVYSDTVGEKTSGAGVTVDGVLLKDNAVTASGGFSGALNGAIGGTTPAAGAFTSLSASGAFSANGGTTLGDASGDALTINSSAVSIPNGLNFDSNTLVIDATNNRVGVGVASPSQAVDVSGSVAVRASTSGANQNAIVLRAINSDNTAYANGLYYGSAQVWCYGGSTEGMRLSSAGNVGIGTSSPSQKFTVAVADGVQAANLQGASGRLRIRPYVDATNGVVVESTNTAENAYLPLSLFGSTVRLGNGAAAIIDSSGNLGLGVTPTASSNYAIFDIKGRATGQSGIINFFDGAGTQTGALQSDTNYGFLAGANGARPIAFFTNGTERARIDSSGNLLVGTTSAFNSKNTIISSTAATGDLQLTVAGAGSVPGVSFHWANNAGTANAANSQMKLGIMGVTSRSISAAGTINASGADYAEYMTKAGDFTIAKGDVVGINSDGKLTNVFEDAVSFVVKSTDPSYVGGDIWGCGFDNDLEGLEAARQLVDRIAFSGQVPVNVLGAIPGQYIIPVNDNGAIKGEAVSNLTFEQYQSAVGKVIAIEDDGRARIIVKVS